MAIKCDYKYSDDMFSISAPRGLDVLPGRMLRKMIRNLDEYYDIGEYSYVKGRRAAEQKEEIIDMVYLKAGAGSYLMGSQQIIVFQKLHPSMLNPQFIQLEEEDVDEFKNRLADIGLEDEYNTNDFSVAMPPDYFIVIANDITKLTKVLNHLQVESFDKFTDAVTRLAIATISIYDEADMFVTFSDKTIPDVMLKGLEDFLMPAERVDRF